MIKHEILIIPPEKNKCYCSGEETEKFVLLAYQKQGNDPQAIRLYIPNKNTRDAMGRIFHSVFEVYFTEKYLEIINNKISQVIFYTAYRKNIDLVIEDNPKENKCFCSGKSAIGSIYLIPEEENGKLQKLSLPSTFEDPKAKLFYFSQECMREIEDTLRAAVLYFQNENAAPLKA